MENTTRRHRLTGLAFWWTVLLVSVTVSSYGNVLHAELVADTAYMSRAKWLLGALAWTLFVMVEGISVADRGGSRGKARTVALCILAPLMGIVLVASYVGLYHLVVAFHVFPVEVGYGWFNLGLLNYLLAVVPDLMMVVSTFYVMSFRTDIHEEPAAARSESRWKRLADAATNRAEAAMAVPATPQAATLGEARGVSVEPFTKSPAPSTELFMEPVEEPVVEVPVPSPKPSVKAPVKVSKPSISPALIPFMDAAQMMVEEGIVTRKSATELAAIIAAVDKGSTPNRIKSELGISPATTAKVSAAWTDWQASHRELVAV